jgi:hypothetical protein
MFSNCFQTKEKLYKGGFVFKVQIWKIQVKDSCTVLMLIKHCTLCLSALLDKM